MKRLILVALVIGLVGLLPAAAQDRKNPVVIMDTSMGKVTIELFPEKAPITVKNFLKYVDEKHYDGTVFHRVIPDFMIQGGGFMPGMQPVKNKYAAIKNEAGNGLENKRGTIAMARTSVPDSATDQFFINVKDNAALDRAKAGDGVGYAVFGQVIDGMDVVDKIKAVKTIPEFIKVGGSVAFGDVPEQNVVIKSVRRDEKK